MEWETADITEQTQMDQHPIGIRRHGWRTHVRDILASLRIQLRMTVQALASPIPLLFLPLADARRLPQPSHSGDGSAA